MGTVTIVVDGMKIEVPAGSRLLSQLSNLITEQKRQLYEKERAIFCQGVKEAVRTLVDGREDALAGMTLVFPLDDGPLLCPSDSVVLKRHKKKGP